MRSTVRRSGRAGHVGRREDRRRHGDDGSAALWRIKKGTLDRQPRGNDQRSDRPCTRAPRGANGRTGRPRAASAPVDPRKPGGPRAMEGLLIARDVRAREAFGGVGARVGEPPGVELRTSAARRPRRCLWRATRLRAPRRTRWNGDETERGGACLSASTRPIGPPRRKVRRRDAIASAAVWMVIDEPPIDAMRCELAVRATCATLVAQWPSARGSRRNQRLAPSVRPRLPPTARETALRRQYLGRHRGAGRGRGAAGGHAPPHRSIGRTQPHGSGSHGPGPRVGDAGAGRRQANTRTQAREGRVKDGITFDTGALIALERRVARARKILEHAAELKVRITVPSAVLVEWWRGRSDVRDAIVAAVRIEPLSESVAKLAGDALASIRRFDRHRRGGHGLGRAARRHRLHVGCR